MHAIVKRVLFPQIPIFLPHFVLLCMYTILWSFDRVYAIEKFVLTLIDMCRKTRQHHETNLTSLRRLRSGSKVIKKLIYMHQFNLSLQFHLLNIPQMFYFLRNFFFHRKKRAVPQSRKGLLLFIFCLKIESNLFFLIFSFYFFFLKDQ